MDKTDEFDTIQQGMTTWSIKSGDEECFRDWADKK
jgi:hypothetical protein